MIIDDVADFMAESLPKLIKQAAENTLLEGLEKHLFLKGYNAEQVHAAVHKTLMMYKMSQQKGEGQKNTGEGINKPGLSETKSLPPFLVHDNIGRLEHDVNTSTVLDPESRHHIEVKPSKGDSYDMKTVRHEGDIVAEILDD